MNKTKITQVITLSDITLHKNEEIDIVFDNKLGDFIRVCNVEGKPVVFVDNKDNIQFEDWHGHLPYKKKINEIEDNIEEDTKYHEKI